MKSYLSLVPISARVHRRQSRMTRICIILAVFLVTAIFSMADMLTRMEKAEMIRKHGNYHIVLKNMPEDEAESVRRSSDVAAFSWQGEINPDGKQNYEINGKKTVIYGTEETYIADIRNYPQEGAFPQNDSEIMLSADAKGLFGVNVGDNITLNTPAGDFHYSISGFCEDDTQWNEIIGGCCAYMNRTAFENVDSLTEGESAYRYYVRFVDKGNPGKKIGQIKQQYGLNAENIEENTAVLGLSGASSNESIQGFYPLAVFSFFLILLAGILMISGCMNSNVAQRTKFFGMLRCIGASRRQIIRFVRLEALNWCKTAIPAGCLLGVITCWVLCLVLRFVIKGEWAGVPLFGVSISSILCGAAVGLITVYVAAHSPAKQAAKVSPMTAVSGSAETTRNVGHGVNTPFLKVETALGVHHAASARKNLILMTGSFALTIALFLLFSACLDLVRNLIPSLTSFAPDLTIMSQDNINSIDRKLPEEISEIPGVEAAFGTMYGVNLPVKINGNETVIDLISYEEFMMNDSIKYVVSGDLSKVYGDSGYALVVFSQDNHMDVGDKIEIGEEQLEIACVVSFGIGGYSGAASVVCSEETFMRVVGEDKYTMVNVILEKNAPESAVDAVRSLAGDNPLADRREDDKEIYGSYWVFRIAAYGFLAIISLITVLNIMNSISMSVSARIRQYGAMRAVGMEGRQVTKMIAAEALTYAFCGAIAGCISGLVLHYLFYQKAILTHFGGTWKIPASSIAVILLLVFVSCIAAVYAPAKRIRDMAITDTINEL
ncbi:MAG: FtsX-like permease family protein [Eubacteriales bacterium]|nr:FtsX-like permease family protein [Eubacteriales bacterium]